MRYDYKQEKKHDDDKMETDDVKLDTDDVKMDTDDVKMETDEKMGEIIQDATSEESMKKECYEKTESDGDEINMHG